MWTKKLPTFCKRNLHGHYIYCENSLLCLNRQRRDAPTLAHFPIYKCSGYGDPSHGLAHNCPAEGYLSPAVTREFCDWPSTLPGADRTVVQRKSFSQSAGSFSRVNLGPSVALHRVTFHSQRSNICCIHSASLRRQ